MRDISRLPKWLSLQSGKGCSCRQDARLHAQAFARVAAMDKNKKRIQQVMYVEVVGHEPRNLPKDHPDLWQWLYTGRSELDKKHLAELLGPVEGPATQDESLF